MATNSKDSLSDALTSISSREYVKKMADQISTSTPVLMKLKKDSVSGGTDIRIPLLFAFNSGAKWYSGSENLNTSNNPARIEAIYAPKQLDVPIAINEADRLKNAGAAKILDLLKVEMEAAKKTAIDKFATGVFSDGTDSKSILGLRVFGSTSNSPGGLSQSTNSWWQASVDSLSTSISLDLLQTKFEAVSEGSDRPGLIACYPGAYNKIFSSLTPSQRFSSSSIAEAGFDSLKFNSADLVVDSYCPSNYVFLINLDKLKFKSYSERPFPGKLEPFQKPVDQDVRIAHLLHMGALISEENRKLGVFSNLAD